MQEFLKEDILNASESMLSKQLPNSKVKPVYTSKIFAVVTVFDSPEILPHFVRHYHQLGVDRLGIALDCEYDTRKLESNYPGFLRIHRTNFGRFANSFKHSGEEEILAAEKVRSNDWVMHLDLDEFHQYPAHLRDIVEVAESRSICAISGNLYDRVAIDGTMPKIQHELSLDEQYPLGGALTGPLVGGKTCKVMLCRRKVKLITGRHDTVNAKHNRWPIGNVDNYKVHHFRWTAELLPRLESRWDSEQQKNWYSDMNLKFCRAVRENGKIDLRPHQYKILPAKLIYPDRNLLYKCLVKLENPLGLDPLELEALGSIVKKHNAKTVLEFGSGASTVAFKGCGCNVVSLENCPLRFDKHSKLFEQSDIELIKYVSEPEISCDAILGTHFDLCLVDGPEGTLRKSRLNALELAAKHTNAIILHDSKRPGEKHSIRIMKLAGWDAENITGSRRGMVLLTRK